MNKDINIKTLNGYGTTLSAVINFPPEFDASQTYPAIVVSHPGGGVKEQTAGLYAKKSPNTDLSPSSTTRPSRAPVLVNPVNWRIHISGPRMLALWSTISPLWTTSITNE